MSLRATLPAVARVALLALLVVGTERCSGPQAPGTDEATITGTEEVLAPEEAEAVELYFPGRGNRLHSEARQIAAVESPEAKIRLLVEELLRGPTGPTLHPPLPAGVQIAGVHVDARAVALVDLLPAEGSGAPSWGSKRELLAVYSLVDTILLNVPEVKWVVLLWNNQQRGTFAGHVDTTHPLGSNTSLISSR